MHFKFTCCWLSKKTLSKKAGIGLKIFTKKNKNEDVLDVTDIIASRTNVRKTMFISK